MQQTALLLVDDDLDILGSLSIHLRADGYRVLQAVSGPKALEILAKELPALAIVDLMMPGMDGFETSRRIKRRLDIPIIILTAIDSEEAKVRAIELYADDYITKPFSYAELSARVARVLRRAWPEGTPAAQVQVDADLRLNLPAQEIEVHGTRRRLSPTEAKLLHLLYANAGRILPNELILDRVWPEAEGEMGYLWEYIRRLRDKLGDDPAHPRYILSERGIGYGFRRPSQTAEPESPSR